MIVPPLPPLTALTALTAWRLQPGVLAVVVASGGGYLAAVRRRRGPWPWSRTACFLTGVAAIGLVGSSFVGVYDDTLFWARAVQNLVLVMVAPLLMALGAPVRLAADLLPPGPRARGARLLHARPTRLLAFPPLMTLLLVVPLLVLYLTPLYERTLDSGLVSGAAAAVLLGTAFVYFWTRFRVDPTPRDDPYPVTMWLTLVEMIGDAALGVVLWFGPLVAAGHYLALHRAWGPSVQLDQQIGAVVLSLGGDLVGLPFLGIIFFYMAAEDARRTAVVDAALDAADAAAQAADPDDAAAAAPRLWWQDDPQIAERFRRR